MMRRVWQCGKSEVIQRIQQHWHTHPDTQAPHVNRSFLLNLWKSFFFIAVVDRLLWPQMQDANVPHAHVFAHGKSTLWRAFHEHTRLTHALIKGILELHYIHSFKLTVSCTRGHEVSRFSWVHWTVLLPGWNFF